MIFRLDFAYIHKVKYYLYSNVDVLLSDSFSWVGITQSGVIFIMLINSVSVNDEKSLEDKYQRFVLEALTVYYVAFR